MIGTKTADHSVDQTDLPESTVINCAQAFLDSLDRVIAKNIELEKTLDDWKNFITEHICGHKEKDNMEDNKTNLNDVFEVDSPARVRDNEAFLELVSTDVLTAQMGVLDTALDVQVEAIDTLADNTDLTDPEVNDRLRNITTRKFKMEKEAKRFWRETQPSSAELTTHVV